MGLLIDTMLSMHACGLHFIQLSKLVSLEQMRDLFGLHFIHLSKFKLTPEVLESHGHPISEVYRLFPEQKAEIDVFSGIKREPFVTHSDSSKKTTATEGKVVLDLVDEVGEKETEVNINDDIDFL